MAAPENLPLRPHTSDQSLQTPDASSLLFSSSTSSKATPLPITPTSTNAVPYNSLEELLSATGIEGEGETKIANSHGLLNHIAGGKRPLEADGMLEDAKRPKIDLSAVQTQIPSILNASKSSSVINHAHVGSPTASASFTLVNPVTVSSNGQNMPEALQSKVAPLPVPLSPPVSGASSSVALLVQLYKHYQTSNDVQGLQRVRSQLLALHKHLSSKTIPGSQPSSLLGSLPTSLLSALPSSAPGTLPNPLPGTSLLGTLPTSLPGQQHSAQLNNVMPTQLNFQTSSNTTTGIASTVQGLAPVPVASGLGTSIAGTGLGSSSPLVGGASGSTGGLLLPRPTAIPLPLPISNTQNQSLLGKPLVPPITVSSTLKSPSIVTQSVPSSNPTNTNAVPLGPLQITAQTQANVLKAVYGYRLQQIQDFVASLPISQRPTSTQELRELLIKNNVLNKGLPNDFLAQFQNSSLATSGANVDTVPVLNLNTSNVGLSTAPITALTSMPSDTGTSHADFSMGMSLPVSISMASVSVSKHTPTTATSSPLTPPMTTSSATPPTSNASTLPGVTLETLKTLCRLPDSDISRIPMPAMLLTLVRYLRSQKWSGSNKDLTGLLQQAQEAMAKGTLPLATPVSQTPTAAQAKQQPPPTTASLGNTTHKPVQASPLSKYMASIGLKTTLNNTTPSLPPTHHTTPISAPAKHVQVSASRPATRYQTKTQQERMELERLNTLQKVLQSSEEARIAFRFQSHIDKLHQQLIAPDVHRPFSSWQDLILRLLPYHVFREPELPNGAMEKADAVYEGIAGVLLSKADGLMSRYQDKLIHEEQRGGTEGMELVIERLWLEGERERREEEEKRKKEAEEIAAELSAVGGAMIDPMLEADPFILDSDPYDTDSFLSQFWNDSENSTDFSLGIT